MFENDNNLIANDYFNEGTIFAAKRAVLVALDDKTRQLNFDDATTQPPQRNNQTLLGDPTDVINGVSWYQYKNKDLPRTINGRVSVREWAVVTTTGHEWTKDRNRRTGSISRLDIFLQLFPPKQLILMVRLTNHQFKRNNKEPPTTAGEIIKFFGVLILITKFEFTKHNYLWNTTSTREFEPAPSFGGTGMSRDRFNDIMQCIRFFEQPDENTDMIPHERFSWMLVDDFVDNFNEWRHTNFHPGEFLCIDESIS